MRVLLLLLDRIINYISVENQSQWYDKFKDYNLYKFNVPKVFGYNIVKDIIDLQFI